MTSSESQTCQRKPLNPTVAHLSREATHVMVQLKRQLRPYGLDISVTEPDSCAQLFLLATPIEEQDLQATRRQLFDVTQGQYFYRLKGPQNQVRCMGCRFRPDLHFHQTIEPMHPVTVSCSCGMPFQVALDPSSPEQPA